ncbi:MAG: winged helix-turn-helix domain-containing protein [Nitrososphaerales archaeon]
MKSLLPVRKKRRSEEIIAAILDTAKNGATKTRIMYVAYLSFSQLQKYMKYTMENRLIDLDPNEKKYLTTDRGFEFLRRFEEVHSTETNAMEKKRSLSEILEGKDGQIY